MWNAWHLLIVLLASTVLVVILLKVTVILRTRKLLREWGVGGAGRNALVVGFFHPYCNAGGGGERVLWHAVLALQRRYSFVRCVVYTGREHGLSADAITKKVQERFGIRLLREVRFVFLKRRWLVEAATWPRLTLLGQAVGSLLLGMEALLCLAPAVYIDTIGCSFTIPLFRWLGGSHTASYVHYPVVSCDMLKRVRDREPAFNNAHCISRSRILTSLKLFYYKIFAFMYGLVGRSNDIVMVNSSWTRSHMAELWPVGARLSVVYPPCDTRAFEQLPLERPTKVFRIVSVGQFRPEKNHALQLRLLAELVRVTDGRQRVELALVGSCRGLEDHQLVDTLKEEALRLGVLERVEFRINLSFDELREELSRAKAALHTMTNEHFGIGVVECMAAGCIMVVHDSGGPKLDIVVDWEQCQTGYLASNPESFVSSLQHVMNLDPHDYKQMAQAARSSVQAKFSVEMFENSFLQATEVLFS